MWVDFCGPSKDQLLELADELGLHELAVEDALGPHQRPKLDHYDTHLFLSVPRRARRPRRRRASHETEIDAFINERWLITVRKDDGFDHGARAAAVGSFARPGQPGSGLLALRPARRRRRQLLRGDPVVRRLLRRGQRGDLRGAAPRAARSSGTGSRCARPGQVPPPRRPHAGSRQQPHAPRARGRRPRSSTPTTRTSTITSCASANRRTPCATW